MDQYTLNLLVVGASFALYIGIAIWARAGSTAEFYAAGQGVPPVMNGMATAADWMSAASFISMAGIIALAPAGGYAQSSFLMGWTGGYVLLALLLAPYLRKFGKFTVPEFVGDRFYSKGARLVAVICLIVISVTYVIGQMRGVGVTFARFLEVSTDTGLYIGASIVFIYAVFGGMKGITYTQVAQYCVLIIAYTIPAIFISLQITGNFFPQLGLLGGYAPAGGDIAFLSKLDQVVTELGFTQYTSHTTSTLNMVFFTMSLMIGTAGLPHVIIRFFTVPRVADARWSAGWALVFIALLYTVAPAVGSMARMNISTTFWPNAVTGEALAGDPISLEAINTDPELSWINTWKNTGLLAFEDKNGDGFIQYYNENNPRMQEIAAERGWTGNELTKIDNDMMVLANPEIAKLPGWVIALVAAGGLAAALSTAAGLLLAISSAVSHDLIKGSINPNISEKGELMAARVSMGFAIVLATWLGLNPPGFAAQVVALAFGLAAATIFPVLMMGIFSKRINKEGAIMGMLVGLFSTAIYIFLFLGWFFIPGTNTLENVPANWLFGISPASFGTVGALLNFGTAYIVSALTKEPPREIQELVESIRVPKGAGAATGH
ncbi:MAG: sodium:solute symporter family protein [Paracoccaceae bacterium]|uniref:sodium:solute symporter family protein n=1 Tax=Seohaeicola saemankumensis TaxID=481181 RepID=UPI001E4E0EDE|nr:sodium:solute symporter family protein [Seohaeicola saemankumensis]MCD1625989.1 cation acetate symporter [Seohaeicola saemankumensis]